MIYAFLIWSLFPHPTEAKTHLILEASLGDESDWVFGVGTQCLETRDGGLYLLDPREFQIRVLNQKWEEIARIGRRGKGPGEFEEPKTMTFTPQGDLAIFDSTLKRMTVFSAKGETTSTHRLDVSSVAIYTPSLLNTGGLVFLSARAHEGKPVYDVSLFNADFALEKTLSRVYSKPMDWSKSSSPKFWVTFLKNEMEMSARGMPLVCSPDGQQIITARSDTYRLTRHRSNGEVIDQIDRRVRPLPFSEPLKNAMFEEVWARLTSDTFLANNMPEAVFRRASAEAEVPDILTLIKAIFPFGEGFGVLVNYHSLKQEGVIDMFDLKGKYVKSVDYRGPAYYLWGTESHLYAIGPDQEETIILNKYRLD